METLDFLTIPWKTWSTNANRSAIVFSTVGTKGSGLYQPFSFELKTDAADYVAQYLYEQYLSHYTFRLDRGPLGGGSYYVESGVWTCNAGMIDDKTGEHRPGPPILGEPALFVLLLSGPPEFASLILKGKA